MTKLLLDYRWELKDALHDPEVSNVLREFVNLLRKTGLNPAPFVENDLQNELWQRLENKGAERFSGWQQLRVFLDLCSRADGSMCCAAPALEPTGIRDNWKRALRDQLSNPSDWRNPQIIVSESRLAEWGPRVNEVAILCEECDDQPASGPHHRVLAVLEHYESHSYAISDIDPWDLQRIHPPNSEAPRQHPALLPKPSIPKGTTLENLTNLLNICRGKGWGVTNNSYCFIPPADFDPLNIDKETWRKGRAFQYGKVPNSDRYGPVDYNGIVWSWDEHERHWDVQTKPKYMRISHTGKRLPDPD